MTMKTNNRGEFLVQLRCKQCYQTFIREVARNEKTEEEVQRNLDSEKPPREYQCPAGCTKRGVVVHEIPQTGDIKGDTV